MSMFTFCVENNKCESISLFWDLTMTKEMANFAKCEMIELLI